MLFLKLIGSAVVIGASAFLGYAVSEDYVKRPRQLRELQAMLQVLENEIGFMSNLLKDALIKSGLSCKSKTSLFFSEAAKHLDYKCTGADEAWNKAITENCDKTSLNDEDREILVSFGKMLGNSDIEGQIKNIRLLSAQLKLQEQKAEELKRKNEALYRNLGILGGLAIVIIFM